ncbi:MAG: hypothetical protein ACPGPE_15855, partial [Planctomycetota bacterium]
MSARLLLLGLLLGAPGCAPRVAAHGSSTATFPSRESVAAPKPRTGSSSAAGRPELPALVSVE